MEVANIIKDLPFIPPFILDCGIIMVILGLIQISPLKINPWDTIKSFITLPKRIDKLENDFNNDRAFRWRSMILTRSDLIRNNEKMSEEKWLDTIETIDRYEHYCEVHPEFKNGKAVVSIEYLREKYKQAYKDKDYLI